MTAPRTHPPAPRRATPRWLVVARYETAELWLGSKGLGVLLAISLALAGLSYLAAANAGINLLDARESVGVVVQVAIGLGTLAALVVSADAISGERERGTLGALLVTPAPRLALVVGKLLAATTVWVAALVVALPFVLVLAQGPGVARDAVLALLLVGSLVAAALTALGLAVSAVSLSNRVSLAVAVAALAVLAAPSQLPAVKANHVASILFIEANPVSAGLAAASNVVVGCQAWGDQLTLLVSPAVGAVLLTLLAVLLSRRIELGGAR
ncbi:MAG: ABC transporter permease [Nocardioides sp.]